MYILGSIPIHIYALQNTNQSHFQADAATEIDDTAAPAGFDSCSFVDVVSVVPAEFSGEPEAWLVLAFFFFLRRPITMFSMETAVGNRTIGSSPAVTADLTSSTNCLLSSRYAVSSSRCFFPACASESVEAAAIFFSRFSSLALLTSAAAFLRSCSCSM